MADNNLMTIAIIVGAALLLWFFVFNKQTTGGCRFCPKLGGACKFCPQWGASAPVVPPVPQVPSEEGVESCCGRRRY